MKRILKPVIFFMVFFVCMALTHSGFSQPGNPPPPPSGTGSGGDQGSGGAPIDGGVVVALAMVAGFGGWKLLKAGQKKNKITTN